MLNFEVPLMFVKDYNNEFSKRQGSLQDALVAAEKQCGKDTPAKRPVKSSAKSASKERKYRSVIKSLRGKESMFKVPNSPPRRGVNLGTLLKNQKKAPARGKWIKYTLSDVSENDMSESTNARTAFSFMKELEDRKKNKNDGPVNLESYKPVFKKPTAKVGGEVNSGSTEQGTTKEKYETPSNRGQSAVKLSFYGTEDE